MAECFVVIGPTGSGKTDLALALAEQLGGEILCADSMTVYRHMEIGTAKPTPAQRQRIKHHLLDVVDPDQEFTVARFVELADAVIADARARRVPLVITGGTPLYYKALFEGLFEGPAADPELRKRLSERTSEQLHTRLTQADPVAAARIHVNDRKRLIRALEVHELTGRPISSWQRQWSQDVPMSRHAARWFGLLWEKEALNRRINARVRAMMEAGWLEETRGLLERFGRLSATAAEATGYRQLLDHLQGRLPQEEAIEQIKIATRQLAKKQMKWFRRFPQVCWLPGEAGLEDNLRRIGHEAGLPR